MSRTSERAYDQIDPTFLPGYKYEVLYNNIGQLKTPFEGKRMGQSGDYGPVQATTYYTVDNRNYPYPLFSNMNRCQYVVDNDYSETTCKKDSYPRKYIPEDYFHPRITHPSGHIRNVMHSETCYGNNLQDIHNPDSSVENYKRLAVAHIPLTNSKFRK